MFAHTGTDGCTGISVYITSDGLNLCILRELEGAAWLIHHRVPFEQPIFEGVTRADIATKYASVSLCLCQC